MILNKDAIVKEYLPLVTRLARDLKVNLPHNVEIDDLIQEGVVALLQAVDKYDPRHGATFKTYVYTRIKGAMIDYLRKLDYLPKNVRQDIKKLDNEIAEFYAKHQRLPTYEELAEILGMSVEEVEQTYNELLLKQYVNLDEYLFGVDDEGSDLSNYYEVPSSEDVKEKAWKSILYEQLVESINKLDEKEKLILSLRFEHDLSLKEIAAVLGVTESRVSQIIGAILSKLRKMLDVEEEMESSKRKAGNKDSRE
ncbi:FliA/WhiG family RNA polymerase sigma factor [Fervidobacterium pennivorans subsp. shakshaketiis]|uniref:RNA polymerase, sigma 28 subunit, SigD/FliA/WhiG n=1 Tax=Fervidobacterium pennivorans (strain DSM 9078 / Ven5) TaxID=771875 RepID=H9U9Z0_FERPD|nr:FliA/WhiG family RNA polymerase sigma factor [Fervidobacterium pennivorans]AFG34333.1 RNA polymerase, sigma 28 subunit, SigD/FliA/WhiG [Fervidobacterium pennivorans DSM 9078]